MTDGWTDNEAINWDDVDTAPPAPIDPGLYRATILGAEAQATSKGKPCVVLTLEATEALEGQELEGRSKQLRYQRIMFSPGALFRAKQLAQASGIEPPESTGYEGLCGWAEELLGAEVAIRVRLGRPSTTNGNRYPEVDRFCTQEDVDELLGGDDDDEPAKPAKGRNAKKPAKRASKGRRRRS